MACRVTVLVGWLVLALGLGVARAESEPLEAHSHRPMKTVVLDNERIVPSTLDMGTGDVLVFENHSLRPMRLTFTAPEDLQEKIRCGLLRHGPDDEARAPWLLFAWDDGQLTATIPPGRFASICSLQKGSYTFLTASIGIEPRQTGSGGGTPEKGQIVVR